MLILLQPGNHPLGQFDLEDDDMRLVRGGEVATFEVFTPATDLAAKDVTISGPAVHLSLDSVASAGVAAPAEVYGLTDEGSASGSIEFSYGTLLGTVIGAAAGQGTGLGATPTAGAVVVGPSTTFGSGKCTLWTKPGLYGVTLDGWFDAANFDAARVGAGLNTGIYGTTADGTNDGKLKSDAAGGTGADGAMVARSLGGTTDPSLVSTPAALAGATPTNLNRFVTVYLLGVSVV